jgi:hypothetical protein
MTSLKEAIQEAKRHDNLPTEYKMPDGSTRRYDYPDELFLNLLRNQPPADKVVLLDIKAQEVICLEIIIRKKLTDQLLHILNGCWIYHSTGDLIDLNKEDLYYVIGVDTTRKNLLRRIKNNAIPLVEMERMITFFIDEDDIQSESGEEKIF